MEIPEAVKKIQKQKDLLESYNNQNRIQAAIDVLIAELELFDYDEHNRNLIKTFKADFSKISSHIKSHVKDGSDRVKVVQFLGTGLSLSKSNGVGSDCVYCGQPIGDTAAKLLKAYDDYFSQQYREISGNRKISKDFFNDWGVVSEIRKCVLELEKLKVYADIDDLDSKLDIDIKEFSKQIESKQDLNYKVDFSSAKDIKIITKILLDKFGNLRKNYEGDLKNHIDDCNKEIIKLEVAAKRYDKYWLEKCNEYIDLQKDHDANISPNLKSAIEDQNKYADSVFSKCQKSINECLEKLGADFRVEKLQFKGRTRSDLFTLVFFGSYNVGITDADGQYSIKTTLSESDKRLLCFAFFMASLKNDPAIGDLVVVLDDPVSSFDFERRNSTAQYLKSLAEGSVTPNQLIILSHDKDFIYMLNKEGLPNSKILIMEWSDALASSNFEILDPATHPMFISTFYKKIYELREYLLLQDSQLNAGHLSNIRHVLEYILKHKYYDRLEDNIRDNQSVETFINTLSEFGAPYENNTSLITEIRTLLPHATHHDQDNPGGYNVEALGPVDIRNKIRDLFKIMEKL